jgi:adenosyl cobinamide kinase/adenosyl cobinamide phosphate guanylyltransferase
MALDSDQEKPTILLQGGAGSGKTTFACRFQKVGIVNLDHNLNGPVTVFNRENRKDIIAAVTVTSTRTNKDKKAIHTHEQWDRMLEILTAYCNDDRIETIVVDSLTVIKNILCAHIMHKYPTKTKAMELQSWGIFEQMIQTMLTQLRAVNKFKIFTGHEHTHQDEDKISRTHLLLPGKSRDMFPALVSDVLRLSVRPTLVGGKMLNVHWCSSAQSEKQPGLKHTFMLPVEFEASQANVDKILEQFQN